MKPITIAAIFLAFSGLLTNASADIDPLRSFTTESVTNAKKLERALSDTPWIYHFDGQDYPLRFGATGKIEKLQWWPNVYWRIIGPSEVLLDNPDGKLMLLRFNDATTTFQCKDWTESSATGSLDAGN